MEGSFGQVPLRPAERPRPMPRPRSIPPLDEAAAAEVRRRYEHVS